MSMSAIDDFPYISNEDVAVLYDIVSLAKDSTTTPFRALFAAYDQVLREHGIEAAQDQVYFRFLLRMREHQKPGQGMLDQFESLLERLGIQVDFEDDVEAEEDDRSRHLSSSRTVPLQKTESHSERPILSRRASFSSFQENTSTHLLEAELNKRRNRPRSIDFDESANMRQWTNSLPERVLEEKRSERPEAVAASSNKQQRHGLRDALDDVDRPRKSIENLPSRPKARSFQSAFAAKHSADLTLDDSDMSGYSSDLTEEFTQGDDYVDTAPPLKELDMVQAARSLQFHHVAAQCTKLFRSWARAASTARVARVDLENIAENQYVNVLRRSVIAQWVAGLNTRQQQRETENFFKALEEKAGQARAIFLLTKAFTHWAASAEEQVLRASAARRHILQTRYFNAWRDITAVNELKVRRLGLNKFMQTWKQRATTIAAQHDAADDFCASHLARAAYTHWFWKFCDRRAPTWYGSKLKITHLETWIERARNVVAKANRAEEIRRLSLKRSVFAKWTSRLTMSRHAEQQAAAFRKQRLLKPVLEDLQREVEFGPSYEQVLAKVDNRIVQTTFLVWEHWTEVYRHATRINDLRIKRNAWTRWNDQLRCQALQKSIDERIKSEVLYTWVLAERLALYSRVAEGKLRQKTFLTWRYKSQEVHIGLDIAQLAAAASSEHREKTRYLQAWISRSQIEEQALEQAAKFRSEHLLHTSIELWINRLRNIQRLESRSQYASFYVLTSRSVKQWHEKTTAKQRNKRRAAYAAVRRRVKENTTRNLLRLWQEKSIIVLHNGTLAWEYYNDHLESHKAELFELWYSRTLTHFTSTEQANDVYDQRSLTSAFELLRQRLQSIQSVNTQATMFARESNSAAAASALRQLNWQLFQRKRLEDTAISLAERTARRRFKSTFKWWAEQAARKRTRNTESLESAVIEEAKTPLRRTLGRSRFGHAIAPTSTVTAARRHDISAFDNGPTSAVELQTPEYLSTPSRHGQSLAARPSVSYTPPGMPQSRSERRAAATPATVPKVTGGQLTPFLRRLRGDKAPSSLRSSFDGRASSRLPIARRSTTAEDQVSRHASVEPGPDDTIVEDDNDAVDADGRNDEALANGIADTSPLRPRTSKIGKP